MNVFRKAMTFREAFTHDNHLLWLCIYFCAPRMYVVRERGFEPLRIKDAPPSNTSNPFGKLGALAKEACLPFHHSRVKSLTQ